ncbi:MAG: hypothetical protein ABI399_11465 [Bauldia sp.]
MTRHFALAALAFAVAASSLAIDTAVTPAKAADPVCVAGFQKIEKKSWILRCRKTVPLVQKGVALTQAGNAVCNTTAYWNFGPQVTATHINNNTQVRVDYKCGHVEG